MCILLILNLSGMVLSFIFHLNFKSCKIKLKQEPRAHMALVTRLEELRAKSSYGACDEVET